LSVPTRKLPGTSYSVQLHPHPTSKNGKLSLIKGKWPAIEKIVPSLDAKTVNSILEDIILSEGFELNPRILSRIVRELLEEMNNLQLQKTTHQITNPLRIRLVRRDIARVKTLLSEHQKGIRIAKEEKNKI